MSSTLKTINDKKFNDIFVEIHNTEELKISGNEELRLFRLKEIIDNEFSKDAFNRFVSRNIGHYVFSRSKIKEYYEEEDEIAAGAEALDLMWASGDADQKGTGNELGEVLIYAFLESVLDAPKIYSKIELKRTVRNETSMCDSMHLKVLPQNGVALNYEMVFGSSSVVGDLGLAIDAAFEQVKQIKSHSADEIRIVDQTVFDLPEDDPMVAKIQSIITPEPGVTVKRDSAYGIFLGYTLGLDKTRPDYREAVDKKILADLKRDIQKLRDKISELGLSHRSFYVYIVPFDDAENDKEAVMKKVMRKRGG